MGRDGDLKIRLLSKYHPGRWHTSEYNAEKSLLPWGLENLKTFKRIRDGKVWERGLVLRGLQRLLDTSWLLCF